MIPVRTLIFSFVAGPCAGPDRPGAICSQGGYPRHASRNRYRVCRGFIRHDNLAHSEVQLAARLRQAYPSGVDVETFESHHRGDARKKVLDLLDTNHDGILTTDEKQNARLIIYGHSWGGSQAIALARELAKEGIPVLLTVQVDSVSRIHHNDRVIPATVAQAANFYQSNGLLHGQSEIRAADPTRTRIIGNFRSDYTANRYSCEKYPWYDRVFVKAHTQIECDAAVWKQADSLIRSYLPPPPRTGQSNNHVCRSAGSPNIAENQVLTKFPTAGLRLGLYFLVSAFLVSASRALLFASGLA